MNSQLLSILTIRRLAVTLLMVSSMAVAGLAQRTDSQHQGEMYGRAGFRGEPINLNVVNADIRDILSYITDQYGINFVIDKSVKDVPVTVKVSDVPWNVALDSILQAQELGVQVNGNILRIAQANTLAKEIEVRKTIADGVIDGSELYTEFIRLNFARASGTLSGDAGGANSMTTATSSESGSGGASGGGGKGGSDQGILGIIKKRLSRRGTVEVDGRTNTLIITDVTQNLESIKKLISYLDQPEPQVEIEARIVVASRNFSRDIGVQLGALLNGKNGSGGVGGSLPNNTFGLTPNPGIPNGGIVNPMNSQIANTLLGLTTGIFGTAQINLLISAGEQKGQAKVIATPRVTALNNRPAEIKSGTKIPITTIQPGAAAGGAAIATTTYVDVPLRLAITPQINDVGSVILNVVAENSSTATIVAGANPTINTQSMTTQVTVPDGGTTVVGGVLFDDERESRDQTPGLSRIPVLKYLFGRKAINRNSSEILFFITPRIVRPDNATATPYAGPTPPAILQPVPMGNPPSNSTRVEPTTNPVVIEGPALQRPVATDNPAITPATKPE